MCQRTIYDCGPEPQAISRSFRSWFTLLHDTYEEERNERQYSTTFTCPSNSNGTDRGTKYELKLAEEDGRDCAHGLRQYTSVKEMLQVANDSIALPKR